MGRRASIEQRYATNKGILPEVLMKEMRDALKRSEKLFDLELEKENPLLKQKKELQKTILDSSTLHQL